MSRRAPSADPLERLQLARAMGLRPLRLRGGRPPLPLRPRLRIVCADAGSLADWSRDPLARQLLAALALAPAEVSFSESGAAPALELPSLASLRASAAARRALWPRLRALRRQLGAVE